MAGSSIASATTPGGLLLVAAVLVPFAGALAAIALGERHARRVAVVTIAAGFAVAVAIATATGSWDGGLAYLLGGWAPPLGIALRADGLARVMVASIAAVVVGIGAYARADFDVPRTARGARAPFVFWTLVLAVWGALNLVFLSGDLFTLYVALELLTFAALPLVCLDGEGETLRAALRYALYALAGSILYLLGAVLVYGAYGTLDIALLGARVRADTATAVAAALMTAGLLAKTALFPLHLWLPPAHAGAPPAASAVLSGLVIKGSWFLVVRLWFDVFPGVVTLAAATLLAGLGTAAIVVANVVALRQVRLKLLVAYSTVAQIGYLFLLFPLAFDAAESRLARGDAMVAGVLQAVSHAGAKAAMFMAAGLVYRTLGHDRIAGLAGIGRARPLAVLAFALAGIALAGLPPSGAFVAKKLMLDAASASGQWWWALVLEVGGALTASYVVLVLAHALRPATGHAALAPVSKVSEAAALALALASLLLGPLAEVALGIEVGATPKLGDLVSAVIMIAGGGVVAAALAPSFPPVPVLGSMPSPVRGAALAIGALLARLDAFARQWPVAGVALVGAVLAFGAAILAGR